MGIPFVASCESTELRKSAGVVEVGKKGGACLAPCLKSETWGTRKPLKPECSTKRKSPAVMRSFFFTLYIYNTKFRE